MLSRKEREVESLIIYTYDCKGCRKCINRCQSNALKLIDNGYCCYVVVSDINKCTGCEKCIAVCETRAVRLKIKGNKYDSNNEDVIFIPDYEVQTDKSLAY